MVPKCGSDGATRYRGRFLDLSELGRDIVAWWDRVGGPLPLSKLEELTINGTWEGWGFGGENGDPQERQ